MKTTIMIPILAAAVLLTGTPASAQRAWTLRECIDYARENNLQVQQAKLTKLSSDEDLLQAKAQSLPTLSASSNQNYGVSKTPDLQGDYKLGDSYNGSYSVGSSMTLYNGGRLRNNLKIQEINNEAYDYDILTSQNDIEINVTQAYLNILYAKATVTTCENNLEASKAQMERAKEMYEAGSIALSDYAQMQAQYSSDNYQLVSSQNTLAQRLLTLKQLLELGLDEEFNVVFPELGDEDILKPVPSVREVYETAVEVLPQMESSRLDIEVAKLNQKVAEGSGLPTVSASASVGTSHTSGTGVSLLNQIDNRLNGSAGISINIPILNGRSVRTSKAKAQYQTEQAELAYESSRKNLLSTIENMYQNAVSAQSRYEAAEIKLESARQSYDLVSEKFNEGMVNAVELLTEKNTYTAAQEELNQAKYEAILSLQLLNFYMNRPIEF